MLLKDFYLGKPESDFQNTVFTVLYGCLGVLSFTWINLCLDTGLVSGNGGMSQKNNTKKTYKLVNDLTIEKK